VNLSIGRISGEHLTNVRTLGRQGGEVSLSGKIVITDPLEGPALATGIAAQIAALGSSVDEPVVPVVWADDEGHLAHLNGFYRVTNTRVDIGQGGIAADGSTTYEWSIDLAPVVNRSAPAVESLLLCTLRTNSLAITGSTTSVDPMFAIPASIPTLSVAANVVSSETLDTETGDVHWLTLNPTLPDRVIAGWRCHPEHWYQGAAMVERQWGTTWLPVIGRDLFNPDTGGPAWRLSNGLLRVTVDTSVDDFIFTYEVWGGSAWESATTVEMATYLTSGATYAVEDYIGPSVVMRNDPCEVRLKVNLTGWIVPGSGAYRNTSVLDLRLRRGATVCDLRWSMPGSTTRFPGGIQFGTLPAMTAFTGGKVQTTADASGNKRLHLWPVAEVNTTLDVWDTSIGFIAGQYTNVTNLRARGGYMAPAAEHVRVVGG
jgi:hypothetical protein